MTSPATPLSPAPGGKPTGFRPEIQGLRGLGITFIAAGLMSVAFMMFSGIQI